MGDGDTVMGGPAFLLGAEMPHEQDIRAVCAYPVLPGGVLTASYDKTVKAWETGGGGAHTEHTTFAGHTGWVAGVCFADAGFAAGAAPASPKPTIASAAWDNSVVLWNAATCQPEWVLCGHTDKVSCVAPLPPSGLVSAGYDKTAIVWRDGHLSATLRGHTAPVSCCCVLGGGDIVTGGAHGDNSLIRWGPGGERRHQYGPGGGGKAGHASGVRAVCPHPAGFVSASNDTTLIVWGLDGAALRTLVGHRNQVYCVACLPSGEVVSGSEDKTVRVWREAECTQTLPQPAFIFTVAALPNGDFASAGTDGVCRVWTRDAARAAPPERAKAFEERVQQAAVKGGLGGLDRSTLPGAEALSTPGTKDGQTKIVKKGEGAEVYSWSADKAAWEKVGDVTDGPGGGGGDGLQVGGGGGKTEHNGKMWDYVFDVDLKGDGSGYFKCCYNKGENPYMAAQRFIHAYQDQGVGQHFIDEIARFIIQNADTGENSGQDNAGQFASEYAREAAAAKAAGQGTAMSNWEALQKMQQGQGGGVAFSEYAKEQAMLAAAGGGSAQTAEDIRRQMGAGDSAAFSKFAQESAQIAGGALPTSAAPAAAGLPEQYVVVAQTKYDKMKQRLAQQNGAVPAPLPPDQLARLLALADISAAGGAGATADALAPLCTVLREWPPGDRVAALDLLRMLVSQEPSAAAVIEHDKDGTAPALHPALSLLAPGAGVRSAGAAAGAEEMLCFRAAANLFAAARGRAEAVARHAAVAAATRAAWQRRGDVKGRRALVDMLTNYALYLSRDCDAPAAEAGAAAADVTGVLCVGLLFEDEPGLLNDAIAALGLLILGASRVGAAAVAAAREEHLSDALRAKVPPTPRAAQWVDALQEALRPA